MTRIEDHFIPADEQLAHHGDRDAVSGLIDLSVNVRAATPPQWLRDQLAAVDLSRYPDTRAGHAAVARRHGRKPDEVLLTTGASEAFVLIARAFTPRHAVVVHPQFTEPEIALRHAGHDVERVVLKPPFTLAAADVPDSADMVVIGNPTNPTSVLHPAVVVAALARPGRVLVIDEAFADAVAGEPGSLAHRGDVPGLIVVRSLTKTWGLAGLRAGYLLADPSVVTTLATAQPQWSVSSLAAQACVACSGTDAVDEARRWATGLVAARAHLVDLLEAVDGVHVVPAAAGPFVLVRLDAPDAYESLRARGYAVRSGESFPGLGPHWLRIAVRDAETSTEFVRTLKEIL